MQGTIGQGTIGIIGLGIIGGAFARNLLASFRDAFGGAWLIDAKPNEASFLTNVLVLSWPAAGAQRWDGTGTVYHDDRNNADRDRVALMWGDQNP